MRHPQWQTDTPLNEVAGEESLCDSLMDVQDMSLMLSIDGERSSLNSSVEYGNMEFDKTAGAKGDPELQDQVKRILSKIKKPALESQEAEGGKKQPENSASKYPNLRRRRKLIVIAVDCYNRNGCPDSRMLQIIQEIFKAVRSDSQSSRFSGFALSTAMPVSEAIEFLKSGKIQATEFDALICSSGSEVYYPGTYTEDDAKICRDPDYAFHIDYRWGREGLQKTISKLMNSQEGGQDKSYNSSGPIQEDVKSSNSHCVSYLIKDSSKAMRVDDLRQKLRMRGLRCHLMYCRNSTRMQVIPLLASRSQALRYLFVRWGLNVANMYVILGETGDTDYEELISGTHKTVIMKGVVLKGSEELLRTTGSYVKDDIVPGESPLVSYTSAPEADEISNSLKVLSKATAGM